MLANSRITTLAGLSFEWSRFDVPLLLLLATVLNAYWVYPKIDFEQRVPDGIKLEARR